MYSLIQAQFDAAQQQAQQARLEGRVVQSDEESEREERPRKRRRMSRESTIEVGLGEDDVKEEITVEAKDEAMHEAKEEVRDEVVVEEEIEVGPDTICVQELGDSIVVQGPARGENEPPRRNSGNTLPVLTRRVTRSTITVAQPVTSPLSSPPPEDTIVSPPLFRKHRYGRLADATIHPSSSPLSSPPPVLFDPFEASSPSDQTSSHSTSPSEVDDSPPSANPFSASQISNSGRNTLPNMKGKDLFDASIWSDPLRTSVFYTFATTLRQKAKDVEPTSSHRFISHLRDRGKLVRCYTQNIDQIEEKVGLSTALTDGPGSRGRFSRRSTANFNQLSRMVDEASSAPDSSSEKPQHSSDESSQPTPSDGTETPVTADTDPTPSGTPKAPQKHPRRELPRSGVECVFLHGSLEQLRCFLCGRVCSWDDERRELETLSGQQPECPHCVGATTAREERGKRALGVGKLRPDIVLYGEDHPNAHLISPIITHDIALCPDLLLILGTSLRVHGLKVMVREFAKSVHAKGGKVIFVNFTKPPESSWGDVIDYWIEWDCDAWVADLQDRIPKLWQAPEPPKLKKKRESNNGSDDNKEETKRQKVPYPMAKRDTKFTVAHFSRTILDSLHRITGTNDEECFSDMSELAALQAAEAARAAEEAAEAARIAEEAAEAARAAEAAAAEEAARAAQAAQEALEAKERSAKAAPANRPRTRRSRKSAPGALEQSKKTSTLNPNHGRRLRNSKVVPPPQTPDQCGRYSFRISQNAATGPEPLRTPTTEPSSIYQSVKHNPRLRKRKQIFGEDIKPPPVKQRLKGGGPPTGDMEPPSLDLTLPPLQAPNPVTPVLTPLPPINTFQPPYPPPLRPEVQTPQQKYYTPQEFHTPQQQLYQTPHQEFHTPTEPLQEIPIPNNMQRPDYFRKFPYRVSCPLSPGMPRLATPIGSVIARRPPSRDEEECAAALVTLHSGSSPSRSSFGTWNWFWAKG